MSFNQPGSVAVLIAAKNAEGTIARAVASVLADSAVGEVVVVDDGSTDHTAAVARQAGAGASRLQVLHLPRNLGPSAARNRAIQMSQAPLLTVLDADDYWLPGRMAKLLPHMDGYDMVADDLLRVVEGREFLPSMTLLGEAAALPRDLTLDYFALANISRPGRHRQELGFLKPVMRRSFLQKHGLRYDEDLRLGEDFILYAKALASGARFRLVEACGYVAVEHEGSISASHGAAELGALLAAAEALTHEPGLTGPERRALAAHRRHVRAKLHHRRVLDTRRRSGLLPALGLLASDPIGAAHVLRQTARDRLDRRRQSKLVGAAAKADGIKLYNWNASENTPL
jgi:succinoglycan biosynthesis protein ExoU